jgi:hypothetical protein
MQWTAAVPKWHEYSFGWIQRAILQGGVNGLFVLPTTRQNLADVSQVRGVPRPVLIGDPAVMPEAITPAAYLARLHSDYSNSSGTARLAIAFTDQLVSAQDASILIERMGQIEFMPVLEVLARCRYAVNVHIWKGVEASHLATLNPHDVLREIAAYFDACAKLGDAWLMRDRQAMRLPAPRVDQARRRLRLYQSTIYNSSPNAPLPISTLQIARRLAELRSNLPAVVAK